MKTLRLVVTTYLALAAIHLTGAATSVLAQGTRSDYERSNKLRDMARDKVFKTRVRPHWLADNSRFWYRNDLPEGAREFVLVDAVEGKRQPAFDHSKLARSLSEATGKEYRASHLPMDAIEFDQSGGAIGFRAADKNWKCDLKTYALTEDKDAKPPEKDSGRDGDSRRRGRGRRGSSSRGNEQSPDGKWTAFVKDHNLHLRAKQGGEEFAISSDGKPDDAYESRFYWSPDSLKLVAMRRKKGDERKVYLIESSPKDQLQPKLHSYDYLKPGDQIAIAKPHLFDVPQRKQIPICDQLFPNPWRVSRIHWSADSRRFMFLYNQRGHQVLRIVAVDAQTGETGTIVDERSKTFIDYSFKEFTHYVDQTHEIVWMSERDGWNHLYLYDCRTGEVKNQVTKGQWVVRGVDLVDEEKRQIWFRAGGIYPEQDPYYIHYCRVNFDGTGLVILTNGNGTHTVEYSPDRRFIVDNYSRVDMPPVTELRRVDDGKLVCELEKADVGRLPAAGWKTPQRFVAKARDGKTDVYGVIYRPSTFDPKKKYPVIEAIYAGPHGSHVPKRFQSFHGAQSMAELGFILVQIDGMGTSNRSKAFHDVCWKNIGDAGFPDRILWIKAAAKKYPQMDVTRVGIYGGSAGGQSSTGALLMHGDFYKVAVSDCGCHDNRMDKIWWNEAWMGWPVGPEYAQSSNVTHAHKLEGKLFLIVGELDRNVDPASTMQVVNALIKADKDFDLLVVPGSGHGLGGAYGARRRKDYFVRHLLGVEPRSEP